ncbi:enoyl-CoA hydratase/isomerase family protein [Maritalea mediterranea]|uniref:3-hydroxyisobutyryl-CoA hydrolase n=1 Tax=Maritalea mediterranea TaxID=2909667 RepID=A0ABS9E3V1_9HYPH|nr:enoyl-CoA hydratase/isomerase family protein [Maritalea mediterranea]MCF4097553.1 enoyl-CoA hydratase/isomerase family protein [Maritalea mediterranea]
MTDQKVQFGSGGKLYEITLNRPKALNSLDLDMIDAISAALDRWESKPTGDLILLSGNGEKGFCAGGDVKAVRAALMEKGVEGATAFFDREYALYQRIANSKIPVVSLQHGIVMGGGIGLSGHAQLRLVREGARFAMPEKSIGFFTDVAVNHLVKSAPLHQRVAFLLTGDMITPADAIALNLSDSLISDDQWEDLRTHIVQYANEPNALDAIKQKAAEIAQPVPSAPFIEWADKHQRLFEEKDLSALLARLGEATDERAQKLHAALMAGSPTSIVASFLLVHRAQKIDNLAEQFALESELARIIVEAPDFAEGVRAVLVDKDNAPKWQPDSIEAVDQDQFRILLPN